MYFVEKESTLLYKEEYNSWITRHEKAGRFSRKDIDLTKSMFVHAAKGEQNDGRFFAFALDGRIGSLDYRVNISELELFRFTNSNDGNVTTFTLSLEDSNLDYLLASPSENGGNESEASLSNRLYRLHLSELVQGSMRGTQFLAYSSYGQILLMDWATRKGRIVGKWPVHVNSRGTSITPIITAALSPDRELVAVIGSSFNDYYYKREADGYHDDDSDDDYYEYYRVVRLFNINPQQSSVKTLKLSWQPELEPDNISVMTFNPFHSNLLYIIYRPCDLRFTWHILVVFDIIEEKVVAQRGKVVMMSHHATTYDNIDSPVFVHHGEMMIAYHDCNDNCFPSKSDYVLLLDAFTLDLVATVKCISSSDNILNYHFLVSTCQTQIAVFTNNDSAHQVEVYKIPTYSVFSLQYLCKQTILGCVGCLDKVGRLTMVPPILRDYLTLH